MTEEIISDEITIRLAEPGDAEPLVRFNQAMALETEGKELVEAVIAAGVLGLLENPTLGFYVVAECGGEVVAALMVTMEWSDWRNGLFWWIQSVYVLPTHRRKGIYRRLYEFVKACAEENPQICGFRLYVEKDNVTAQRTYDALGMVETHYRMYEELKSAGQER
ncbi:MAG: GNAT family N-acetyltransferase [Cyanothece sp. SIO2G6]|nr:GNAT family N-acetyltransferase [Cyanothece sp. SIO2G6]